MHMAPRFSSSVLHPSCLFLRRAAYTTKPSHKSAGSNKTPSQPVAPSTPQEYLAHRLQSLAPHNLATYPRFSPPATLSHPTDFISKFDDQFAAGQWGKDKGIVATLVGRITGRREASKKLIFLDLVRDGVRVQVISRKDEVGDNDWEAVKGASVGDIISVMGYPGRSPAGELSLRANGLTILTPCLRNLPRELTDPNLRFRSRHLDLLINPHVHQILRTRSQTISYIRNYLTSRSFLEVETPTLSALAGGATAKPFVTYSHALEQDMYLRIAPELYLKRLVIGGIDKVFEIGKQFRNEDIDTTHNPEFSTCEFYMAYAGLEDVMSMTEELLRGIVAEVKGGQLKIPVVVGVDENGNDVIKEIDFEKPFERIDVTSELEKRVGRLPDFESPDAIAQVITLLDNVSIPLPTQPHTLPRLLDQLISHLLEPELLHPTFLTNHPYPLSPLAKRTCPASAQTARFELFIANRELVNAYEELNDPFEQRKRFEAQRRDKEAGDEETGGLDEGFCKALEVGLPPTTGWGLGVDRLVMLLTGQRRIREVIAFPVLSERGRTENEGEAEAEDREL